MFSDALPSETANAEGFFDPCEEVIQTAHRLIHWHQDQTYAFVTWRLGDSLPQGRLEEWRTERAGWLAGHPRPWSTESADEFRKRFAQAIDRWLDAGEGACLLRHPSSAEVVASALRHLDGQRYRLDSFVIMPNHVHVLFQLHAGHPLSGVIQTWKSYSSRMVNRALGRSGQLWHEDYWDRLIRDEGHLESCREYIRENPVKGRLRAGEYLVYGG